MALRQKRGIDVKIIMPHIPDKDMRTYWHGPYYPELIASE